MSRPSEFPSRNGCALVTGGSVRIGGQISRRLAQDGWPVAIHYRSSKKEADALAAELRKGGVTATTVAFDLSARNPEALFTHVDKAMGFCSLLVNNASAFEFDDIENVSADSFDAMIATNLRAPVLLAHAFKKQLPKNAFGLVVNILDQKVFNLNPDFFSYTIAKSALLSATEMLALALAPQVRVCGVAPGLSLRSGGQSEEGFEAVHGKTPLGFGNSPADVADAVAFLVHMPAMTGVTLAVDGGQHLVRRSSDVMFSYSKDDEP